MPIEMLIEFPLFFESESTIGDTANEIEFRLLILNNFFRFFVQNVREILRRISCTHLLEFDICIFQFLRV